MQVSQLQELLEKNGLIPVVSADATDTLRNDNSSITTNEGTASNNNLGDIMCCICHEGFVRDDKTCFCEDCNGHAHQSCMHTYSNYDEGPPFYCWWCLCQAHQQEMERFGQMRSKEPEHIADQCCYGFANSSDESLLDKSTNDLSMATELSTSSTSWSVNTDTSANYSNGI